MNALDQVAKAFGKLYQENTITKAVFPETEQAVSEAFVRSVREGVKHRSEQLLLDPGSVQKPDYTGEELIPWERSKAGFALIDTLAASFEKTYPDHFEKSDFSAKDYAENLKDYFPTNFGGCVYWARVAQARA